MPSTSASTPVTLDAAEKDPGTTGGKALNLKYQVARHDQHDLSCYRASKLMESQWFKHLQMPEAEYSPMVIRYYRLIKIITNRVCWYHRPGLDACNYLSRMVQTKLRIIRAVE